MKAVAVIPGKSNSIHLRDIPRPGAGDVPGGRGILAMNILGKSGWDTDTLTFKDGNFHSS